MTLSYGLCYENQVKGNSNLWVCIEFGLLMTQGTVWFWFLVSVHCVFWTGARLQRLVMVVVICPI